MAMITITRRMAMITITRRKATITSMGTRNMTMSMTMSMLMKTSRLVTSRPRLADFDKDEAFKKAAAASVVVLLITLIGVATLVPCKKFKDILIGGWFEGLVAAFAAGALLA
eukprot:6100842-Pleurochrysis_carterae.AAC.1